jgi:membrane protease YdiL (CAAX protease family)
MPSPPTSQAAGETAGRQHPIGLSIGLHLLPGAAMLAFVALLQQWDLPGPLAGSFGILFVLVPLEVGYLLYRGRQAQGRFTLAGVIQYRAPIPLWQYAVLAPILIFWYFQASSLWSRLLPTIATATAWLPAWVTSPLALEEGGSFSPSARLSIAILAVICGGIIAPVVEELFFRGALLPGIDRFGVWGVLLNSVLFAVYHLWTPLLTPGRVLAWFPIVLAVWWKRNIWLGLIVHLVTNLAGVLPLLLVGPG